MSGWSLSRVTPSGSDDENISCDTTPLHEYKVYMRVPSNLTPHVFSSRTAFLREDSKSDLICPAQRDGSGSGGRLDESSRHAITNAKSIARAIDSIGLREFAIAGLREGSYHRITFRSGLGSAYNTPTRQLSCRSYTHHELHMRVPSAAPSRCTTRIHARQSAGRGGSRGDASSSCLC